ncbi:MAG: substrate-binding domain-containing protein [Bryobacteraceae bacterium]
MKKVAEPYLVEAVARACDLLIAFEHEDEVLRLKDLVARTGLNPATALRLIATLEQRGFIQRIRKNSYRSNVKPISRKSYRFGYGSQGEDAAFSQEWSDSIVRFAASQRIDLIVLNNGFDSETALRNADAFIEEKVDLVIEHQFNERLAPIISAKLLDAGIPLIAMGTAHPGATYYGGNNYGAGLIGGRYLGRWAKKHWHEVDELLLLELSMAGPLLQSRLTGVEVGVKEVFPKVPVIDLQGTAHFGDTLELVRKHVRHSKSRRILVGAVNDPCALGALRAFEESGLVENCAVMGQGGSAEGRAELRRPGTHLVGTVAFFPEKYGQHIISLALDILSKKPVPPAVFVDHQLLTPANVDHYYPNDLLNSPANRNVAALP